MSLTAASGSRAPKSSSVNISTSMSWAAVLAKSPFSAAILMRAMPRARSPPSMTLANQPANLGIVAT